MTLIFQIILVTSFVATLAGLTVHYFEAANAHHRDPPSLPSYLGCLAVEPLAVALALILAPLSWLSRTLQQADSGSGPAVVVISGSLWGSPGPCMPMQWTLWRRGLTNVHAIALPHARGSIDKVAASLVSRLKQVALAAGGQPIHIIAHGSAGLALRFALTAPDLPRLGRVVTIGCPHLGTMSAVFFSPQTGILLRLDSPFLQSLPPAPSSWLSIFSDVDPMIIPSDSAELDPSSEKITGLGHFQLLLAPSVCHLAAEYLLDANDEHVPGQPLEDSSRFA